MESTDQMKPKSPPPPPKPLLPPRSDRKATEKFLKELENIMKSRKGKGLK